MSSNAISHWFRKKPLRNCIRKYKSSWRCSPLPVKVVGHHFTCNNAPTSIVRRHSGREMQQDRTRSHTVIIPTIFRGDEQEFTHYGDLACPEFEQCCFGYMSVRALFGPRCVDYETAMSASIDEIFEDSSGSSFGSPFRWKYWNGADLQGALKDHNQLQY